MTSADACQALSDLVQVLNLAVYFAGLYILYRIFWG